MNTPILYGSYMLPPSVNELYDPALSRHGKLYLRKSQIGREYEANLLSHLNYPDSRYELYIDEIGVRMVREWADEDVLRKFKKKSMKTSLKPVYELEVLCVFGSDRSDVDGRHKAIQDVLTSWLGINDNRIYRVIDHKTLGDNSHVEFALWQIQNAQVSLLDRVRGEFMIATGFHTNDTVAS